MKFGKFIQTQQSEWQGQYMSYKGLKKIINSLEALPSSHKPHSITVVAPAPPTLPGESEPLDAALGSTSPASQATTRPTGGQETREMRALKTAFFYRLERELEKVNSFYLQKESEFKVRLRTLEDKKRIMMSRHRLRGAAGAAMGGASGNPRGTTGTGQVARMGDVSGLNGLREGFMQFQTELTKLQKFVDINATGFRKILKKWDKRSHSTVPTKDLYLARQVEIQPIFFNRDAMAELSDRAASNLAEVEAALEAAGEPVGAQAEMAARAEEARREGDADGDGDELDEIEQLTGIPDTGLSSIPTSPVSAVGARVFAAFGGSASAASLFSSADPDFYFDLERSIVSAAQEGRLRDLADALGRRGNHGTSGHPPSAATATGLAGWTLPPPSSSSFTPPSNFASHPLSMSSGVAVTTTAAIPAIAAGHTPQMTPTLGPHSGTGVVTTSPLAGPSASPMVPFAGSPPAPPADTDFLSRVFLRLCADATLDALRAILAVGEVDIGYRDDISDRTALHEAAIAGRLDVMLEVLAHHSARNRVDSPDAESESESDLLDAVDIHARSPLHYVAMYGHVECARVLLARGASQSAQDLDGYTPLAHAVTGGHDELVDVFLQAGAPADPSGEAEPSPLCMACEGGKAEIVRALLDGGAKVSVPNAEGVLPLHISARSGHAGICRLLIERGADPDAADRYNGWTPLFYAAAEGKKKVVEVLLQAGSRLDTRDESGWDAGAYAVYRGHVAVGNLLRAAEGRKESRLGGVDAVAPTGKTTSAAEIDEEPVAPSAFLLSGSATGTVPAPLPFVPPMSPRIGAAAGFDLDSMDEDGIPGLGDSLVDFGSIPPLSLPPPIVPFRIYGHNFLDRRTYVQLKLGHRKKSHTPSIRREPISLFGSRQLSSLKLIISARPESGGALPYNIILPLKDDSEVFTFVVDNLPTLHLDIYPTFGTKVIARGTLLPSTLGLISREGRGDGSGVAERCIVPLMDTHLRVVGEMCFECEIVTPFQHKGVVIGGKVETYWKSTRVVSTARQGSAVTVTADGNVPDASGIGVNTLLQHHLPPPMNAPPSVQSFVTASSLAEEYIVLPVQLTRDGVPVVFKDWYVRIGGREGSTLGSSIPISGDPLEDNADESDGGGILLSVSDLTVAKFRQLGEKARAAKPLASAKRVGEGGWWTSSDLATIVHESFLTLDEVLETLSSLIGVNIEIKYPTYSQQRVLRTSSDRFSVNATVDAVLTCVYERSGGGEQRSIIFSSFNPAVCTAANWKQPNYAVFFSTHAGYASLPSRKQAVSRAMEAGARDPDTADEDGMEETVEEDERCTSIKEAIRFARAGNLLGIVCEAAPLVQVPALINTIKEGGLILATFGDSNNVAQNVNMQHQHGVDALLVNNVLKYNVALL